MTAITRIDTRNVLPMEANYTLSLPAIEAKFHAIELLTACGSLHPRHIKQITAEASRRSTELYSIIAGTAQQGGQDLLAMYKQLAAACYFEDIMMIRSCFEAASELTFSARYFWYRQREYRNDRDLYVLRCQQDHQFKVDVQLWGEQFVVEARMQAAEIHRLKLAPQRDLVMRVLRDEEEDVEEQFQSALQEYERLHQEYLEAHYRHAAMQELYL